MHLTFHNQKLCEHKLRELINFARTVHDENQSMNSKIYVNDAEQSTDTQYWTSSKNA